MIPLWIFTCSRRLFACRTEKCPGENKFGVGEERGDVQCSIIFFTQVTVAGLRSTELKGAEWGERKGSFPFQSVGTQNECESLALDCTYSPLQVEGKKKSCHAWVVLEVLAVFLETRRDGSTVIHEGGEDIGASPPWEVRNHSERTSQVKGNLPKW